MAKLQLNMFYSTIFSWTVEKLKTIKQVRNVYKCTNSDFWFEEVILWINTIEVDGDLKHLVHRNQMSLKFVYAIKIEFLLCK